MSRVAQEIDFAGGRGDFKLIVKYGHSEPTFHSFVVSSSAMILACKPWERMLSGPFGEGRPEHPRILDFTEDNYGALEILMNVIHLRFNEVPRTLELTSLADLAILTDRYDLTALVAPWIAGWVQHLYASINEEGTEVEWLWISWEYGALDIFNRVLHKLCIESSPMRGRQQPFLPPGVEGK